MSSNYKIFVNIKFIAEGCYKLLGAEKIIVKSQSTLKFYTHTHTHMYINSVPTKFS